MRCGDCGRRSEVTDEMVEVAAKALYGPDGIGYGREMEAVRIFYRTQARAALEAALEVTT